MFLPILDEANHSPRMRKAFLLGAGLGTRLQPLTNTLPKPLIPFENRPLITHVMDHCIAAGLNDFAINTHHLHESWAEALPSSTNPSFSKQVAALKTSLTGSMANLSLFIMAISSPISPSTASSRGTWPQTTSQPSRCKTTAQPSASRWMATKLSTSKARFPAFKELVPRQAIGAYHVKGSPRWLDLGTRDSYLEASFAQPAEIHPEAQISPSSTIENSWIGANCQIEDGAVVKNSILWPGTQVSRDAELTNCILHSNSSATGHHNDADL